MQDVTSGVVVVRSRSWRRFFLLLGMFLGAFCVADLLPMGGWSDVRSKWLNAASDAAICIIFLIAAVRTYWKGGHLTGLQTSLLCLLFGSILIFAARQLYADMVFLGELRRRHASVGVREPNKAHPLDGGIPAMF